MIPDVYVVERILDCRVKGGETEYKIKWKGWTMKEYTWEPEAHLVDYGADEIVKEWHTKNANKIDPKKVAYMIKHAEHKTEA